MKVKWNCTHVFTIEARDRVEFDERLREYVAKVNAASARLDIGYQGGYMCGSRASGDYRNLSAEEVERLFDD